MTTSVEVAHFDKSHRPPLLVLSRFERGPGGTLRHYTDDNFRAELPPESWDEYAKAWPECAGVIATLRTPVRTELDEAVNAMLAASHADLLPGAEIIVPASEQGPEPTPEPTPGEQA